MEGKSDKGVIMGKRTLEEVQDKTMKKGLLYLAPEETSKTTLVLGKSRSGKTFWLVQEVNKLVGKTREVHGVTRPIYDKIIVFTESLNAEPFKDLSKNLPILFIKGYIPKLVLLLKKINDETKNLFRFLVILDDCIGSVGGKSLRGGSFPRQMLTYRNANISTVVLVQGATLLEPKTRENAHQIVITGLKIRDQTRCINELLYDEARRMWPNQLIRGEALSEIFFKMVGNDILYYDNLNNKAYTIKRPEFKK